MLPKPPRHLPAITTLVEDLLIDRPETLANYLGVPAELVRNWLTSEHLPRAAHLALFWPSRWGRSELDCDAYNERIMDTASIRALAQENRRLANMCQMLMRTGTFDASNDAFGAVFASENPGSIAIRRLSPLGGLSPAGNDP